MSADFSHAAYMLQQQIAVVGEMWSLPHVLMRPRIFKDGDRWCALYGEDIQNGVAAFGETPEKAAMSWNNLWWTGENK